LSGYYKGTRFWTCYPSKEAFELVTHHSHTVVGQGEDEEEVAQIAHWQNTTKPAMLDRNLQMSLQNSH
jgi:hypothetical protein